MSDLMLVIWSAMLSFFGAGLAWLINRIHKMLDDLRIEDTNIRTEIHKNYVRRDDYLQLSQEIREQLNRIEDKLDKKQDRRTRP